MKVRVIDKNYIELERSEIIVELTVVINYWLFNVTKVYRKVHGEYFLYRDGQYTTLSKKKIGRCCQMVQTSRRVSI